MDSFEANSNEQAESKRTDVEVIFLALLQTPAEDRQAKLFELCDEEAARNEVIALLEADDALGSDDWLRSPLDLPLGDPDTVTYLAGSTDKQPTTGISDSERPLPADVSRFRLRRRLGGGGFADVYVAWDPNFQRCVAIKIAKQPVVNQIDQDRFLNEARALRDLRHDHIVQVYDADITEDNRAYIVMEFVDGQTLRECLHQHGELSSSQVAKILSSVCRAMAEAHRQRIIHRDLKPANILLDEKGEPKVSDFGLAIRGDTLHPPGEYAGTTPYMSPEQIARKSNNLDGRTDVWSLGVIMYEMLTGTLPFKGKTKVQSHSAILNDAPRLPREITPGIPRELEALCLRCLEKDRELRNTTARDLAVELEAFVSPDDSSVSWQKYVYIGVLVFACAFLSAIFRENRNEPIDDTSNPSQRGLGEGGVSTPVSVRIDAGDAKLHFIPLTRFRGVPDFSQTPKVQDAGKFVELAPGYYWVVAIWPDGIFHEVLRYVPHPSAERGVHRLVERAIPPLGGMLAPFRPSTSTGTRLRPAVTERC